MGDKAKEGLPSSVEMEPKKPGPFSRTSAKPKSSSASDMVTEVELLRRTTRDLKKNTVEACNFGHFLEVFMT